MIRAQTILIIAGIALQIGCAGRHTLPDTNYAENNGSNSEFVVAFDQDGSIYPFPIRDSASGQGQKGNQSCDEKMNWHDHYPLWRYVMTLGFSNSAFSLKKVESSECQAKYYDEEKRLKLTQQLAKEIKNNLKDNKKVYVFIHGFNNTYDFAMSNIASMRGRVNTEDGVTLSVLWDGLHSPSIFGLLPVYRWNKSMTYSNMAGQVGLRSLFQSIGEPVNITFITHSRGAGVALSTIYDPLYDFSVPDISPLTAEHVRSVKMVMLAPAVGDGHVSDEVIDSGDPSIKKEIFIASNTADFATCKVLTINSSLDGDTRLGCGDYQEYIDNVRDRFLNYDIPFEYTVFSEGYQIMRKSHSVETYLHAQDVKGMLCRSGIAKKEICTSPAGDLSNNK